MNLNAKILQSFWDQPKFSCIKIVLCPRKYDTKGFPFNLFLTHIMAIRAPRLFQATLWLSCLLILMFFITFTCASQPRKPRLNVLGGHNKDRNGVHRPSLIASDSNNDYQTFYYDQTLNHFNY